MTSEQDEHYEILPSACTHAKVHRSMSPTVSDSVASLVLPAFPDLKNADEDDGIEKIVLIHNEEDDEDEDDEQMIVGDAVGGDDEDETTPSSTLRPYPPQQIDQQVFIKRVADKGRCLFARRAVKPGEIIFVEGPVLAAVPSINPEIWEILSAVNDEEPLVLPPVWHLAAITSLTSLSLASQRVINNKFVPDPDEPPSRDVQRVLQQTGLALDPDKYQRTLNAWRFNGFGHHAESDGLILYDRELTNMVPQYFTGISNMAHSCNASATWHYGAGDAFVLRARKHLNAGDEITISYIGDEDLLKATHVRREKLASWQFTCSCERCSDPIDRSRGFRCPDCGTGSVFLKSETFSRPNGEEKYYTNAQSCTVCSMTFDTGTIAQYEEFEEAYIARLDETSKEFVNDLELVYQEAGRVFTQHHVIMDLETMLYEAYKDQQKWMQAAWFQQKRIDYVCAVSRGVRIKDAWMYEDLGDLLSRCVDEGKVPDGFHRITIARAYETAFNSLILLCGPNHEYTRAAHAKFVQTMSGM